VHTVALSLNKWDEKVLIHAIRSLPQCERLEIVYIRGRTRPREVLICSLGRVTHERGNRNSFVNWETSILRACLYCARFTSSSFRSHPPPHRGLHPRIQSAGRTRKMRVRIKS
jgi:hypothetical protein